MGVGPPLCQRLIQRRRGLPSLARGWDLPGGYRASVSPDRYTLAGSDVSIPSLGVGTWAWGDRATWGMGGYDAELTRGSIKEAWDASIDAGITLFDTAEVYGRGESERIIGSMLTYDPQRGTSVVVATKFMPSPWKLQVRDALLKSLRASLDRLGLPALDLYQIHGPISLRSHSALADALAAAHQEGLVKAVGVSNYSAKETRTMSAALRSRGLQLATNQIEFSLLRRSPETSGLLRVCAELGVLPLAYSPVGQGRLTGKYSATHPPPGKRTFSKHPMAVVDVVVAELRKVGDKYGGKTPSQVALNWVIAKGVVPIPGAKNRHQAEENAGALGWQIDDEDLERLDRVALPGIRSLQSRFWQHG
jgi:aryl-alcohol dehydrogenase-like predicted oxidoreductase